MSGIIVNMRTRIGRAIAAVGVVLFSVVILDGSLAAATPGSARLRSAKTSVDPLTVVAEPTLRYDQSVYHVHSGVVRVRLVGAVGITMRFALKRLRHCLLINVRGGRTSCTVDLASGSYLVYDATPSHRAAGVAATIVATP
jgi:hypothetical protein